MLIVIEGLDGAGKSTQVKLLREYLQVQTQSLRYIHFPQYDSPIYGDLIGKFLRGAFGSIDSVHPQLVALLFAEDRHSAASQIRQALDNGETVLLDRYVYSNIAYQCAKLDSAEEIEELREWIINTEYGAFNLPRPDVNIFLDVPFAFVEKSLSQTREGDDNRLYLQGQSDIHESDIKFQKRVRQIYKEQTERDPSFVAVDCSDPMGQMLPPDRIFERLKELIQHFVKEEL